MPPVNHPSALPVATLRRPLPTTNRPKIANNDVLSSSSTRSLTDNFCNRLQHSTSDWIRSKLLTVTRRLNMEVVDSTSRQLEISRSLNVVLKIRYLATSCKIAFTSLIYSGKNFTRQNTSGLNLSTDEKYSWRL